MKVKNLDTLEMCNAVQWNKHGDHSCVWQDYISGACGDMNLDAYYVNTKRGTERVIEGDWIVTVCDGEILVFPNCKFKLIFTTDI